jgi:hypothetical protein
MINFIIIATCITIIIILLLYNFSVIKILRNLTNNKNKEVESIKKDNDTIAIIIVIIIIIFFFPYFFTRPAFSEYNFSTFGQIGDTIGGITSPFINGLAAILVYIAFKEQKKSNDLLKEEIEIEKRKEKEKLEKIKTAIIYDLEVRIKPNAEKIIPEISKCLEELENTEIKYYNDHVDFNDRIFKSNNLSDYLKIFDKATEDFNQIINIYNRVMFIYKHTPLQISFKYPTDKNNIVFIGVSKKRRNKTIERHLAKKKIELELLTNNVQRLVNSINDILDRYKENNS